MQQIPRNMPKAPSFDNVQDMIKWYRKAYRIPTFKNKAKRISKEYGKVFKEFPGDIKYAIDDFRKFLGLGKSKIPSHLIKKGILGPELKNHLLKQFDDMMNDAEKQIRQKYKNPTIQSQLLKGALGRASGVLGLLIPSSLDQENTAELPYPQRTFPTEDAQIEQQQLRESTPRVGYYGGGIVQPTAPKTKRRKRKKTSWNY